MQSDSSNIKVFALKVVDAFDRMARPEIRNIVIEKIWNYVANYSRNIILKKPDIELKIKLQEIHGILDPLFKKVDMANELKLSKALNSPEMTKKLMQLPNFKDLEELLDGV